VEVLAEEGVEIGWLAWRAPRPVVTVAVRVSVALDLGDTTTSAEGPRLPGPSDPEELPASDLVPLKRAVDVVLVGFAYAPGPRQQIAAQLAVGSLDIALTARTLLPSTRIPLDEAHVVGPDGASLRVGERSGLDRRAGVPLEAGAFDFGTFQIARPEQRLPSVAPLAPLRLAGLRPEGRSWEGRLPAPPRLALRRRTGPWRSAPVTVDTVRLDTDAGVLALVGRAVVEDAHDVIVLSAWSAAGAGLEGLGRAAPRDLRAEWPA
jgi:hypothetical protein